MTNKVLDIHTEIDEKLEYFIKAQKIPNIIFHGPSGSGKRTIVNNFIKKIYNNSNDLRKKHVMYVDCGHGRGIKFIREELKFFAKTNIHTSGDIIKSVILLNADKLTIDAQSALRRCIELFSKTTRFFIIIEDKFKLLRPILSRFCEIFINNPTIKNKTINLHEYNNDLYFCINDYDNNRMKYLQNQLSKLPKKLNQQNIINLSNKLYQKGYSGLDLMNLIENKTKIDDLKKYELLCTFSKIKKEFRNEKIIIYFIIFFTFFRSDHNLENISFI
tara:strand:+ start:1009 stop:1830 length:822 start_codon:yes stop_codon:yes gene_type:complete